MPWSYSVVASQACQGSYGFNTLFSLLFIFRKVDARLGVLRA